MSDFAVYANKHLQYKVLVVTSERHLRDKIEGDSRSLRQLLRDNKIDFFVSSNINTDTKFKKLIDAETLGLAFGAAWIFEKKTVKYFAPNHLLDFMGIDLPRYRGGAHYTWQILHQNRKGAAFVQVITGGLEDFHRGPIIGKIEYNLPTRVQKPIDYFEFMSRKELPFLKKFFVDLKSGKSFAPVGLAEDQSSFYPFLATQENGYVNWQWTGKDIFLFINAFDNPYAGASTFCNEQRVFLHGCTMHSAQEIYHPFTSGIIVRKDTRGVYVASLGKLLRIEKVTDEKGRDIIKTLKLGERLYTPSDKLDSAMKFSAAYGARGLVSKKKKI